MELRKWIQKSTWGIVAIFLKNEWIRIGIISDKIKSKWRIEFKWFWRFWKGGK